MDDTSEDMPIVKPAEKTSTTIHTLMPELLAEIFLLCVPVEHDYNRCSIRDQSQAPFLLGRVCSRWRTVSICSNNLWSTFAIEDHDMSHDDCMKDLEATKVWISRSGSRPLSIYIHHNWNCRCDNFPRLLELVVSQSSRWKNIQFTVPSEFDSVVLAPFRTGRFPELESFASTILGSEIPKSVPSLHLSSVPKLQTFRHFLGVPISVDFGCQIHHVKNLHIILDKDPEMPGMSLGDLLTCLTQCPLLEELTFPITKNLTQRPHDIPSAVDSTHLRHLGLSISRGIDPGYLFDVLFLPALISLDLTMDDDVGSYADWPHLRSMLARSRPRLYELRLAIPITEATLIECLAYIPSILDFSIDVIECTDTILDALTLDENYPSRSLCPSLQAIELAIYGTSHFSANAMMSMILSRRQSTCGNVLEIVRCRSFDFDSILSNPAIATCVDAGLELSNQRPSPPDDI